MPIDYRLASTRTVSFNSSAQNGPGTPSKSYLRMQSKWELVDDLLGGTEVMRSRGERWLPREPKEEIAQFRVRLSRSFLYGALKNCIGNVNSKPFSQPTTIPVPAGIAPIDEIEKNVDMEGTDLTQFGSSLFSNGAKYGKAHILVNYSGDGMETVAEEQDEGVRPFFKCIDPRDLIGWKYEVVHGSRVLKQVRILECECVDEGPYAEREAMRVRVINSDGTWELHELNDNQEWKKLESGNHTFPGIPLVTIYFMKSGFMESDVPFQDLAELNLCHWQSYSDHRNYLRFCRIGMIAATGLSQEEYDKGIIVAPNQFLKSTNPAAKFYYVEAGGQAVTIGETDIKHIEERMETMGAAPFQARSAMSTATSRVLNVTEEISAVQTWIRVTESGIKEAYAMAAKWMKMDLPEDFSVSIFKDFTISVNGSQDAPILLQACISGKLTTVTFLKEIKRRGMLGESVDPEAEADEAQAETPDLLDPLAAPLGGGPPPPGGNPPPPAKPGSGPAGGGNSPPTGGGQ